MNMNIATYRFAVGIIGALVARFRPRGVAGVLFVGSAWLFRRAARGRPEWGAA